MAIKDRGRVDEHWAELARKEGYPARSVYKLKELDESMRLLRPGMLALDLGAFPGSWSIYAMRKGAKVVGVDLERPMIADDPKMRFFQADVLEEPPPGIIGIGPFQAVLSDLAPKTTGQKADDSAKSLELVQAALSWAERLLERKGLFVFKVFQGADFDLFYKQRVKRLFDSCVLKKPKAVRKKSVELYAVCRGFKGAGPPAG